LITVTLFFLIYVNKQYNKKEDTGNPAQDRFCHEIGSFQRNPLQRFRDDGSAITAMRQMSIILEADDELINT
jgi:hypothetical protein